MTDGLALAELVEVRLERLGRNGEVLVEETEEVCTLRGLARVVLESEELDSVAGGEDKAFADAGLVEKGASGVGKALGGDGEALADLDGAVLWLMPSSTSWWVWLMAR